jgi:hypothetical protein
MMHSIRLGGLVLAAALFGCTDGTGTKEADNGDRRPLAKADMTGACQADGVSYCGRKSAGNCWCNDSCVQYGDCCSDYQTSCTQQSSPLAQLKALLTAPGALGMPPAGRDNWANEHEISVTLVSDAYGTSTAVKPAIAAMDDWFTDYEGTPTSGLLGWLDIIDGSFQVKSGHLHAASIRRYLLDELVQDSARAEIKAILETPGAFYQYSWIQAYDIGAEIIGVDIVVIKDFDTEDSLVVKITYVHS